MMTPDELNDFVYDILGENHEVSVGIREGRADMAAIHIVFSIFEKLNERITELEERKVPVSYTHLTLPTILLV